MKVVLFNWAPIWKGAHLGGGVNGYLHALAPKLAAQGHEVTSVFAGLLHTERPRGCFSRRHDDFEGVRVIEIINSPVLAPSAAQFREPISEIHAPELEEELRRLMELLRPDIAHWHNVEGFSAGCIDVCRAAGASVVYSLHNYHTLCSQVTLCKGHEKPCMNFESGHACSTCVESPDPFSERQRRQAEYAGRRGDSSREAYERALAELKHELSWPKRLLTRGVRTVRTRSAFLQRDRAAGHRQPPGRPAESIADLALDRGSTETKQSLSLPVLSVEQLDASFAERAGPPLANVPRRDPTSGRLLGAHARRRAKMVEMLNRCDRVLAVSDFVRLKFEAEGVLPERIGTMRIGTPATELARPVFARGRSASHLRLVFLGFHHFNKGLPLLLTAMRGMSGDQLRRIGLSVYAPGVQSIGPEFRKLCPPLAELHIRDRYEPTDLPGILSGHDLCYVGSAWWDPLPQTVLESLAHGTPVLGAEAGGIPEALRDGESGFLFRANDPASLRSMLCHAVECFGTSSWPSRVEAPKSITAHAKEMSRLYEQLRARDAEGTRPERAMSADASRRAHEDRGARHHVSQAVSDHVR